MRRAVALVLAATCGLGGCGTYASLYHCSLGLRGPGESWVYGGVGMSVQALKEIPGDKDIPLALKPLLMAWAVADLPLSAVADTAYLPYTVHATLTQEGLDLTRSTPDDVAIAPEPEGEAGP